MPKRRRSLEIAGNYEIPADNIVVIRPDTVDREVPNVAITPSTNKNYGLFSTGIGYNMHGELIDYNNNGTLISIEKAKERAKDYAIRNKLNRHKNAFERVVKNIK